MVLLRSFHIGAPESGRAVLSLTYGNKLQNLLLIPTRESGTTVDQWLPPWLLVHDSACLTLHWFHLFSLVCLW